MFSNNKDVKKLVGQEIENILNEYYESRKRKSEKISLDKVVLYTKILLTLNVLLAGKQQLIKDEVLSEFKKAFLGSVSQVNNDNIIDEHGKLVYESKMDLIKKICRKKKITVSEIFKTTSSKEDILDYIWLRKHGLLYKSKDGRLAVSNKVHLGKGIEPKTSREIHVSDISKYLGEIPSSLWSKILDQSLLRNLNNTELIDIISKFYGYSPKVNKRLLREIEYRINNGWKPTWYEWKKIGNIVPRIISDKYVGPYSLEYINIKNIDLKKVIDDINSLPLNERWKIVSKLSKNKDAAPILESMDPITLSCINKYNKVPKIRNKVFLGKALSNYFNFLITGDESYLDYSIYYLDKIDPQVLDHRLKPLYKSLANNDYKSLTRILGKYYPDIIIEYLSLKLFEFSRVQGVLKRDKINKLIRIGYDILKYSIKGKYKLKKKIKSIVDGKIDTRKTIFNLVRYNYEIARIKAKRTTKISALVDISGSMTKYSLWAILSLAQLIPLVKVVVLFSEKTRIVKMPRTSSRKLIIDFLEHLYTSFGGYTNISKALREVAKYVSPNEVIVVFSDLEQTVPDTEPWIIVKELISKHNASIVFFVPPYYRIDVAEKMKSIGCEVIVARSPELISKWLRKRLNFKIRHKIIHVRGME